MSRSEALFERAKKTIPGGVNSPVRAFKAVGGTPRFMERADGAYLFDADGRRYIDYVLSWGPMIMGHNHPGCATRWSKPLKVALALAALPKSKLNWQRPSVVLFPAWR